MKDHYDHSDTGNAELLNDLYGGQLRYDNVTSKWYQWLDGHHYWQSLLEGEIRQFAIRTAQYRAIKASNLDGDEAKSEFSFAVNSRNLNRQNAMITIAPALPPIGNKIIWDDSPELLATANGVVDLRSGRLRPGMKTDYITRGLHHPYIPYSDCPRWEQFIREITCNNHDTAKFLQRAIGYTLTGSVREQVFFLLHGTGSNGKSVLLNIIGKLLEGFAKPVRFNTFEENNISDAKRDLAELPGIRAVFASEGSSTKAIDTAIIKQVTGSEPITTSRKYGHPFTYKPQFKLWLTTNNLPKVDDDSYGFWRRIIIIPFDAKFEGDNKDEFLEDKLTEELNGILAWAIDGARIWFEQRLSTPNHLLLKVVQYRDSQDEVEAFVQDSCIKDLNLECPSAVLYLSYCRWCQENGRSPMSNTLFGRKMGAKFSFHHSVSGKVYEGVFIRIAT